jgi:transcriptional regulator with XRE-family HTH domain
MEKHHGQIVERMIRRNGYSISELARLTKVNRRSVYNWFNQRQLKPEIIFRIGCVLNHDFSTEFPGLFSAEEFNKHTSETIDDLVLKNSLEAGSSMYWKDKYIDLLEKYNELLIVYVEGKD